jgi:hypothetical protein
MPLLGSGLSVAVFRLEYATLAWNAVGIVILAFAATVARSVARGRVSCIWTGNPDRTVLKTSPGVTDHGGLFAYALEWRRHAQGTPIPRQ